MNEIDTVRLAFSESSLQALNVVLGFIMFGVALDLSVDDFKHLLRTPRAPAIGLLAQFLLLPALAWALSRWIAPAPSIALGMILVSACPGGNISNYITWLAKGRVETSVGMTAISTTGAVLMTPLNTVFWGNRSADTAALVHEFALDPVDMFLTVLLLLGIPIVVGMGVAHRWPGFAERVKKPFKIASIVFFLAFIGIAFQANWDHFLNWVGMVFFPVLIMNACAFLLGWGSGWLARLDGGDRRAVAVEVGIQNSGLGLILVFNFFEGLGGMAIVAAWWGIWHIIAGLSLAAFWSWRGEPDMREAADKEAAA